MHVLVVLSLQASSSTITVTMSIMLLSTTTLHAIHAMQNGAQIHMSITAEVMHVICEHCDCHPITIQDVATVVTTIRQDASLLVNNLGARHSNCIPIVYSNWLQDCNSQGVFLCCTQYLL